MRLEQVRRDLEALERSLAEEHYQNLAGLKPTMDTGPIYARHAGMFERGVLDEALQAARAPDAGNRHRFLADYLAQSYLEARVQPLSDEAESLEASLKVPTHDGEVPYRLMAVRVANEPHRDARKALSAARDRVLEERINPVLRARLERMHSLARDLGFRDYAELCARLKGHDYAALRDQLDPLLTRTNTLYRWHMEGLLGRGAGVILAAAEKHDVAHAIRAPWFDDQFPRGTSLAELDRVLQGMGLHIRDMPNLTLDIEERPAKSPRAFVVAVRVPEDVRLVVQPKGGYDDYRSLFHEAGHALHFGLAKPGLDVEYRYLGDNAVTEGFAFVLEHILVQEAWAKGRVEPHLVERYVWQQRVLRLFMVRRYAAKLRYELELHTKGPEGMEREYSRTLTRALVFQNPGANYLSDVDDAFYCANYLRAWALDAVLRRQLAERFGATWWEERGAGDWLRGLWAEGQRWTAEQLAEQAGTKLTFAPLQEELIEGLREEPKDFQSMPKF
ncbi:MAG: hypothetical protein LC624_04490 [Halobacteriales archaeon]|nr:hypothetical protein [Halobacteriales archaeon]